MLKLTALPAEFGPSDGVTGAAQFALHGSVKSAGLSVMPVAKCPLSHPLPPFRDFQHAAVDSGIFRTRELVFDSQPRAQAVDGTRGIPP